MPRRTHKEAEEARGRVTKSREAISDRHLNGGESVSRLATEFGVTRHFLTGMMDTWGIDRRGKHQRP